MDNCICISDLILKRRRFEAIPCDVAHVFKLACLGFTFADLARATHSNALNLRVGPSDSLEKVVAHVAT